MKPKILIFADIDGTILDDQYNSAEVQPIINDLISFQTSIILTSSKTKAEIEFYREKLGINEPFVVENGSAIIIPKNYFKVKYGYTKQKDEYNIIQLGTEYTKIREELELIRRKNNASIIGFGDMTNEEVATDAGLPLDLAALSKKREYDEPFKIINGNEEDILRDIENRGLFYTKGGRYFHVLGKTDKGKAISILKQVYLDEFCKIAAIGIGDSQNDLSMFSEVDVFFLIGKNSLKSVWQEVLDKAKCFASSA